MLGRWSDDYDVPLPRRRNSAAAKYEYGILALERATECFWECSGRTARYDRLVRRVTRITREHGDTKRCVERLLVLVAAVVDLGSFVNRNKCMGFEKSLFAGLTVLLSAESRCS